MRQETTLYYFVIFTFCVLVFCWFKETEQTPLRRPIRPFVNTGDTCKSLEVEENTTTKSLIENKDSSNKRNVGHAIRNDFVLWLYHMLWHHENQEGTWDRGYKIKGLEEFRPEDAEKGQNRFSKIQKLYPNQPWGWHAGNYTNIIKQYYKNKWIQIGDKGSTHAWIQHVPAVQILPKYLKELASSNSTY